MFHTYLKYKERLEEKRFYEFLIRRQNCSDPPNVPCSAERSGEGSVIFSEFSVPLFKGGTGKVWGTFIFPPFISYFIFSQT